MGKPKPSATNKLKTFCHDWKAAGLGEQMQLVRQIPDHITKLEGDLAPLNQRVNTLLALLTEQFRNHHSKPTTMFFWVMYDISNNKVRSQLAKFLIRKGLIRMQKSVFVGNMSYPEYEKTVLTLREVQALYENKDSIVVAPLDHDHLKGLHVIGEGTDLHLFTEQRSTLFF